MKYTFNILEFLEFIFRYSINATNSQQIDDLIKFRIKINIKPILENKSDDFINLIIYTI